jgi:hypothetical protein
MDVEMMSNESIAEENAGLGDDKTDKAVDELRAATVQQARMVLTRLVAVMDEDNATRVLRMLADLATTNIAILTDLDPAGLRNGPRAKLSPGAYGLPGGGMVNIGEPMVAGGMNNETFGAQALGQLLSLVPQIQMGNNVKGLTNALKEAKEAGLDEEAELISAKLKNVLGHATGDEEPMPEAAPMPLPEPEEPLRECMYCGREISKNEDMCGACADKVDAGELPAPPQEVAS